MLTGELKIAEKTLLMRISSRWTHTLQSTLVISKSKRLSKTLRDIRTSTYQILRNWGKPLIEQPHFTNEYVIWLLNLEIIENILEKKRNCSSGAISPLFSIIFCYLLLDFHVKTGIKSSLRGKRLFEISEVEITRVDCICINSVPLKSARGRRDFACYSSWTD